MKRKRFAYTIQIEKNRKISRHIKKLKNKRILFECKICGKKLISKLNLINHSRVCSKRKNLEHINTETQTTLDCVEAECQTDQNSDFQSFPKSIQYVQTGTQTDCPVVDFKFPDEGDPDYAYYYL